MARAGTGLPRLIDSLERYPGAIEGAAASAVPKAPRVTWPGR